jgi:catechol 2,3-dioxygenase-like lactoylglutathione lyase family enzyme
MPELGEGTHSNLHSERGALRAEHTGRAKNPVIKVVGLAWLEFRKPDLQRAETFARDFGFEPSLRTPDELHLRAADEGPPCLIIRHGPRPSFVGPVFTAAARGDLLRLAGVANRPITRLPESLGGEFIDLHDPSGMRVRVVAGARVLPPKPAQPAHAFNFGHTLVRVNDVQRPPRAPATVQRVGHVVLQTTRYRAALDWYLDTLGLIVSDFLYFEEQRERGPVMSFIRADLGATPADHHTLAMMLGTSNRYVHSAYEVADLDAMAAGGKYLAEQGYRHSWGIGRHIQGSQIFDYWRDPDGFMVEHYADGDKFDSSLEPGWAPMTASRLAQWGPPPTRDFLGTPPSRGSIREVGAAFRALRSDNEFDLQRLRGMLTMVRS